MRAGDLIHHVTIQVKGTTPAVGPGKVVSWSTLLPPIWAQVTPLTSRELIQAQAMGSTVSYTVRIRYRPTITAAQRVLWAGKTLQIHSVVRVDGRPVFLDLLCGDVT